MRTHRPPLPRSQLLRKLKRLNLRQPQYQVSAPSATYASGLGHSSSMKRGTSADPRKRMASDEFMTINSKHQHQHYPEQSLRRGGTHPQITRRSSRMEPHDFR